MVHDYFFFKSNTIRETISASKPDFTSISFGPPIVSKPSRVTSTVCLPTVSGSFSWGAVARTFSPLTSIVAFFPSIRIVPQFGS